jgi:hypothetical protein
MSSPLVKRLVLLSVVGTSVSMLLMMAGVVYPSPFLLVLVMSLGQALGLLSLALFLLAVALDLQGVGSTAYDTLPESDEDHPPEIDEVAPPGLKPGA